MNKKKHGFIIVLEVQKQNQTLLRPRWSQVSVSHPTFTKYVSLLRSGQLWDGRGPCAQSMRSHRHPGSMFCSLQTHRSSI